MNKSTTPFDSIDVGTALIGLAVIVVSFIDFLRSEEQKKKFNSSLENLWFRLEYAKWYQLGREESKSFLMILDVLFGDKFFSWRRLLSCVVIGVVVVAILISMSPLLHPDKDLFTLMRQPSMPRGQILSGLFLNTVLHMVGLAVSVSLTQVLARVFINRVPDGFLSVVYFPIIIILQLPLIPISQMSFGAMSETIGGFIWSPSHLDYHEIWKSWWENLIFIFVKGKIFYGNIPYLISYWKQSSVGNLTYFAATLEVIGPMVMNGMRILFAVLFVVSWFFNKPMRWFVSVTLARLAEKGTLTMMAVGVGVFAKAAYEVGKKAGVF